MRILPLALVLLGGCYGHDSAFGEASLAWQRRDEGAAIAYGEAMLARYREANPALGEAADAHVPEVRAALAEGMIVAPASPSPPPAPNLSGAAPEGDPESVEAPLPRPGGVDGELRARLRSLDASPTLTAIAAVEGLGLRRFGPELLLILERPEPFAESGSLTATLSPGARAILVKTFALEALRNLAGHGPEPAEPGGR